MTIVLQHQFWDLKVDEGAGELSVGLSFGGVPTTLHIPLGAVTGFADPQVQFGLRFKPQLPAEEPATPQPLSPPSPPRPSRRSRSRRSPNPRWSAWTRSAAAAAERVIAHDRVTPDERPACSGRPVSCYAPMFPLGPDATPWRKLAMPGVTTTTCDGRSILKVAPAALTELAFQAFQRRLPPAAPGASGAACGTSSTTRRRRPTTGSSRSTC